MKYALIGCGRISPNHLAAAIDNKLEIVAVCDVVPKRMEEKIKMFNLEKSQIRKYIDYKELLKNEKLDLIAIATESGKHANIALDCLEMGVNLIIEKPIALSIKDADRIINKAKEKNLVVCTNHQNRFNKAIQKIKQAIDNGQFGKLMYGTAHIRWNRRKEYYEQAPWRGTWEQDGGCLMNQCIHNIDLLRWMMGDEVDEVYAYTDNLIHKYIDAEDFGIALIKFKNKSYGIIEGTTNIYPNNLEETLYVFGETGTAKAGGKSVNTIEEWNFTNESQEEIKKIKKENSEQPNDIYGFGHNPLYADVIQAIEKGTRPLVDAEAGKRALELVLAIYKSATEHKPVKLPLIECSTLEFKGRFN